MTNQIKLSERTSTKVHSSKVTYDTPNLDALIALKGLDEVARLLDYNKTTLAPSQIAKTGVRRSVERMAKVFLENERLEDELIKRHEFLSNVRVVIMPEESVEMFDRMVKLVDGAQVLRTQVRAAE